MVLYQREKNHSLLGGEILMAKPKDEKLNPDQDEIMGAEAMSAVVKKPVIYVCKRGHRVEFDKTHLPSMMERTVAGVVTNRTRPICSLCHIEWMDMQFGMDRAQ